MFRLYKLYEELILESKNIITEAVSDDVIIDAINNKYRVNLTYDSGDGNNVGKRNVEVYAYGDINGYPSIRVFQLFGDTKTQNAVWKTLRKDRILSWEPTNFKFYNPVSDRDNSIPRYREDGYDDVLGGFTNIYASFDEKYRKR